MTAPDTGSSRQGRIAGVALLGLAAVALIIGLITALGGNGDGNAANQPPSSATSTITGPPSTTRSHAPSTTKSTKPSTSSKAPTTTTNPPGQSQTNPPGDGNGEPQRSVPVRVYNNSTTKGLARTAADDLRADGWQVTDVSNYPFGRIPTTTVYYRPGTEEEAAAREIAATFGMRVEERFEGIKDAPAGVIVIVTNDYNKGSGDGKNEGS